MGKENKKTVIITLAMLLIPVIAGLVLWNRLPEQMPSHWNFKGEIDGYGSKAFIVFGLNALLIGVDLFCIFWTMNDPKKKNISAKNLAMVLWLMPLISLFANGLTFSAALGAKVDVPMFGELLLAAVFIIIGNYMPKVAQNYTIGIKLPWTLASEENWNRTHRFAGKLWVICGFVLLIGAFLGLLPEGLMAAIIIAIVLIPTIYSFCYFQKEKNAQGGKAMKVEGFVCPVCGQHIFEKERDYEICPVCGWENDGFYEAGGANKLSLEEYKTKYFTNIE